MTRGGRGPPRQPPPRRLFVVEAFDVLILGAGSAAREAAARAVEDHGARVALIERERWGGQCPNVACKPTKQYVAAAEQFGFSVNQSLIDDHGFGRAAR